MKKKKGLQRFSGRDRQSHPGPHSDPCGLSVRREKYSMGSQGNGPRLDQRKKNSNIDSMLVSKHHHKNNGSGAPIFCQMSHFYFCPIASTPRVHRVIVHSQECRPDFFLPLEEPEC